MKKKLVLAILSIIIVSSIITGCSSKEEKLALERSIERMRREEYIEARNELINYAAEGNDEIDEAFIVIESYLKACDCVPNNLDKAEEYLKKAKNYKKYPIKNDIEELKEKINIIRDTIAQHDKDIKELNKLMKKKEYDEAETIIKAIVADDYSTKEQKEYAEDCRNIITEARSEELRQQNEEIANKIKEEQEQKIKKQEEEKVRVEEEFNKEKAIELVEELNSRKNAEYLYEVVSDIKYDEYNKKYCEIVSRYADWVKFGDYTIISYMKIYADGTTTF